MTIGERADSDAELAEPPNTRSTAASSQASSSATSPSSSTTPPETSQIVEAAAAAAPTTPQKPIPPPPPSVLHPRGRIWPPLSRREALWRRFLRGVIRLAQGLYHHDDIFHMAPAMAFHFFLSLLPLLVFVGYLIGLVSEYKGAQQMLDMLLDNLPSTTEAMLKKEMSGLTTATRLGPLAAIGFFWIASGGTQGLMQAIERVVGVPPRAWWRQRLLALAWVMGTLLAIGIGSFSIVQWDEVVHVPDEVASATASTPSAATAATTPAPTPTPAVDEHDGDVNVRKPSQTIAVRRVSEPARRARKILRDGGERVIAIIVSLVVAVVGLAGFYQFAVAHSRRVKRQAFPGAAVAVALIIVITWGFSLYVSTLASYTVYYGSLAAIAVLLVWFWLMSIAILVGAELNSQLEGLRDHPRAPSYTPERD